MFFTQSSKHYAPKFIESHYGTDARLVLRKIERTARKIERRRADLEFLRLCSVYRLVPKLSVLLLESYGDELTGVSI